MLFDSYLIKQNYHMHYTSSLTYTAVNSFCWFGGSDRELNVICCELNLSVMCTKKTKSTGIKYGRRSMIQTTFSFIFLPGTKNLREKNL